MLFMLTLQSFVPEIQMAVLSFWGIFRCTQVSIRDEIIIDFLKLKKKNTPINIMGILNID